MRSVRNIGLKSANKTDRVKQTTREYARELRKDMTPSEKLLWERVRGNRLGVKVCRQRVVRGYIADFYCASAQLVIELDGRFHTARRAADKERDEHLGAVGIRTLRIPSSDCFTKMDEVVTLIRRVIYSRVEFVDV